MNAIGWTIYDDRTWELLQRQTSWTITLTRTDSGWTLQTPESKEVYPTMHDGLTAGWEWANANA